ncbi:MAG TPA: hypothetical protein VG248_08225 [Caulobacteraceae bacterium]|jgi:hypothetical protein|nr:hypothetical protein [Caulobacteraceae bacterium]
MTFTNAHTPAALRDVFYEFAREHPRPDAAALDAFTRRYPEYAADLTEFAIELAVDALLDRQAEEEPVANDDDLSDVDVAMSRFHNRLYEVRRAAPPAAGTATASVENPFLGLDRQRTRALATRLHANTAFVMMLRDREIEPDSMTVGFQRELEDELQMPIDVLCAHFAAPPQVQGHVRFSSQVKPEANRRLSFAEAVKLAGLSAEQQAYLLSL